MAAMLACAVSAFATEYYVDDAKGDDAAAGTSPESAWRTLARTSLKGSVKPGDTVRLKRGGLWRETLVPVSGKPDAPVVYTSYGNGRKPVLVGSVERSRPEDWVRTGPDLWSTCAVTPSRGRCIWDASRDFGDWSGSRPGGSATISVEREGTASFLRVQTPDDGARSGRVQLWGPKVDRPPMNAVFEVKVRASKPCRIERVGLGIFCAPHSPGLYGYLPFEGTNDWLGTAWRTFSVAMRNDYPSGSGNFYIPIHRADLPDGLTLDIMPVGIWEAQPSRTDPIVRDVGCIVLNRGERWGVKRMCRPEWTPKNPVWKDHNVLKDELDFWYEPLTQRVTVKYPRNPGAEFRSIELALNSHIVNGGYRSHVVFDGLALRYGAAHGFSFGSSNYVTVRNCDIRWIGGGLNSWSRDQKTGELVGTTRWGNGIEFWAEGSHILVESNRVAEVYDAALTIQGGGGKMIDVVWRNNIIWNCEYSFEFWNGEKGETVDNIFEGNICVNAGYGWSFAQRPNPCATHVQYFRNSAPAKNFVVRNNVFAYTKGQYILALTDRRKDIVHDGNVFAPDGDRPVISWLGYTGVSKKHALDWNGYRALGFDPHGRYETPVFRDPAKHDYRLRDGRIK